MAALIVDVCAWSAVAVLFGGLVGRTVLFRSRPAWPAVGLAAAAALPLLGVWEMWLALEQLRSPDAELLLRYATTTAHGEAVAARTVAGAGLWAWNVLAPRRTWPLALVLGTVLAYGFSVVSHGAAMAGGTGLALDLVHLLAAATWVGSVWRVAFAVPGPDSALAVTRLSRIATASVAVLAVAGIGSAGVHAGEPAAFVGSAYASTLAAKVVLVGAALCAAGVNRFVVMPRAVAGGPVRRRWLVAEAGALAAVLIATAVLAGTPVPHGSDAGTSVVGNLIGLLRLLLR